MRRSLQFVIAVSALVALAAGPASAGQLPRAFEGIGNPHMIFGVSYLTDDPGAGQQRFNSFVTINVPILTLGSLPCAALGVGLTGADLGPPYDQFDWGASVPILTCAFGDQSRFVAQGGWTVSFVGDQRPTGYYAGVGIRLDSSATLARKRAEHKAKKEAEAYRKAVRMAEARQ